ncbi:hypothetical protein H0H92_001930, partial [Tricholoma furcatifolium]
MFFSYVAILSTPAEVEDDESTTQSAMTILYEIAWAFSFATNVFSTFLVFYQLRGSRHTMYNTGIRHRWSLGQKTLLLILESNLLLAIVQLIEVVCLYYDQSTNVFSPAEFAMKTFSEAGVQLLHIDDSLSEARFSEYMNAYETSKSRQRTRGRAMLETNGLAEEGQRIGPKNMKFARDYRGLKKRITAIRKAHESTEYDSERENENDDDGDEDDWRAAEDADIVRIDTGGTKTEVVATSYPQTTSPEPTTSTAGQLAAIPKKRTMSRVRYLSQSEREGIFGVPPHRSATAPISAFANGGGRVGRRQMSAAYPRSLVNALKQSTAQSLRDGNLPDHISPPRPPSNPMVRLPLDEFREQLDPLELAFFNALDEELEKIDVFYAAREAEMMDRTRMLHEQLDELGDHKKLVQSVQPSNPKSWTARILAMLKDNLHLSSPPIEIPRAKDVLEPEPSRNDSLERKNPDSGLECKGGTEDAGVDANDDPERKNAANEDKKWSPTRHGQVLSSDPEDYFHAKKKLKKAVLEHYRGLEVLQNYRILNYTGFRKALKKFEKATKIPAQRQYMSEKVDRASFASGKNVQEMMKAMEMLYATRF